MESQVLRGGGVGPLLREWRRRRRLSQLDLAVDAGGLARHVSFVETGRSRPSADMVLHLAEWLDVPLRERNRLLLAAGYAPVFEHRDLDDPSMTPVREAVQRILEAHEPYPALVVDGAWEMIAANRAVVLPRRPCDRRRASVERRRRREPLDAVGDTSERVDARA